MKLGSRCIRDFILSSRFFVFGALIFWLRAVIRASLSGDSIRNAKPQLENYESWERGQRLHLLHIPYYIMYQQNIKLCPRFVFPFPDAFTFSRIYQPWRLELLRSIRPSRSQVLLFAGFLSHATSDDIAAIAIAERVPMASPEEFQQLEITALRSIYDEDFIECPPPKAWKVSWTILLHGYWFFTVLQGAGGLPEFIIKVPHPDPTHASKVNVQLHVKWV